MRARLDQDAAHVERERLADKWLGAAEIAKCLPVGRRFERFKKLALELIGGDGGAIANVAEAFADELAPLVAAKFGLTVSETVRHKQKRAHRHQDDAGERYPVRPLTRSVLPRHVVFAGVVVSRHLLARAIPVLLRDLFRLFAVLGAEFLETHALVALRLLGEPVRVLA